MQFTLKQIFALVDGRLSCEMKDVYVMLNTATGKDLMTHQLPSAMEHVKEQNHEWFQEATTMIERIKSIVGNDFWDLMDYINENHKDTKIDIPEKSNS